MCLPSGETARPELHGAAALDNLETVVVFRLPGRRTIDGWCLGKLLRKYSPPSTSAQWRE